LCFKLSQQVSKGPGISCKSEASGIFLPQAVSGGFLVARRFVGIFVGIDLLKGWEIPTKCSPMPYCVA